MKTGLSIVELATKLDAQAAQKKDFIAPTSGMGGQLLSLPRDQWSRILEAA